MKLTELDLPEIDLLSPEFEADPIGVFGAAREQSWLARTGSRYAALRHTESRAMLKHPDFQVSFTYVDPRYSEYLHERQQHGLMASNGPRHVRLRGVAVRALRPHIVDALREPMRNIVDELLDKALVDGSCDIVQEITDPYPTRVMTPILGIPPEDLEQVDRWASDSVLIFDVAHLEELAPRIEASSREFDAYVAELVERRRKDPGPDVISELIRVCDEGEKLDEAELRMLVASLVPAALDTTRGQLGFTLEALVRHPEQWAKLAADPGLADKAVEEGLRFAPAVSGLSHVAVRDTEFNGVEFPQGTIVAIYPRAANHDPRAYPHADTFDIEREVQLHFTFGFGPHACLGSQLARIEMTEALSTIAKRVATWESAGEVTHQPMSSNGNRLTLPARFTLPSPA